MTERSRPKTRNHLRRHSKRRSDERLRRELTRRDHERFVRTIEHGQAAFLFQQSANTSFWRLTWDDLTFIAIFDHQRRALRTIYDEDLFENAIATGRVPHPDRWADLPGHTRHAPGDARTLAASALAGEDWEALMTPVPAGHPPGNLPGTRPYRPDFSWKDPLCMELAKQWIDQERAARSAPLDPVTPPAAAAGAPPAGLCPNPAPLPDPASAAAEPAWSSSPTPDMPALAAPAGRDLTPAPDEPRPGMAALVSAARAITPDVLRAAALLGAIDGPLLAEWTWVRAAPDSLRTAARQAFTAQLSAHTGEDPAFTAEFLTALP